MRPRVHDEISFSLRIHHSGTLGEWGYYDGKTWKVHGLTWDTMSMVRIDRMCQGLKIKGMLRQAEIEGIIDLYVQHLTTDDLRKAFRQQEVTEKSKLTFEEIDEISWGLKESSDSSYKGNLFMPLLLEDGIGEVTSNVENQPEGGSQEFHVQGTFDDSGFASYSGFADCFFDMNEDTITDNDCLHTSANGNDIGEDIIRHDNESQMPTAKDDGIGQTIGNRSEVESQHDADVRNDNEGQMPNVEDDGIEQAFGNRSEVESAHEPDVREAAIPDIDLVNEDYDMISGDEDVAIVFNDIDKGNIGGRPKGSGQRIAT
ncbi:hypothetical protein GH714_036796 [Hevea brasiliensis]|uniref:Uncharacterized protein n=1 Tax=Hevea brasiliensis TaxID=3981 RepID=A0A6A6KFB9_HEVBR|nr:hypothetical protein GH714_036796 [Hevea brasiliensis]